MRLCCDHSSSNTTLQTSSIMFQYLFLARFATELELQRGRLLDGWMGTFSLQGIFTVSTNKQGSCVPIIRLTSENLMFVRPNNARQGPTNNPTHILIICQPPLGQRWVPCRVVIVTRLLWSPISNFKGGSNFQFFSIAQVVRLTFFFFTIMHVPQVVLHIMDHSGALFFVSLKLASL